MGNAGAKHLLPPAPPSPWGGPGWSLDMPSSSDSSFVVPGADGPANDNDNEDSPQLADESYFHPFTTASTDLQRQQELEQQQPQQPRDSCYDFPQEASSSACKQQQPRASCSTQSQRPAAATTTTSDGSHAATTSSSSDCCCAAASPPAARFARPTPRSPFDLRCDTDSEPSTSARTSATSDAFDWELADDGEQLVVALARARAQRLTSVVIKFEGSERHRIARSRLGGSYGASYYGRLGLFDNYPRMCYVQIRSSSVLEEVLAKLSGLYDVDVWPNFIVLLERQPQPDMKPARGLASVAAQHPCSPVAVSEIAADSDVSADGSTLAGRLLQDLEDAPSVGGSQQLQFSMDGSAYCMMPPSPSLAPPSHKRLAAARPARAARGAIGLEDSAADVYNVLPRKAGLEMGAAADGAAGGAPGPCAAMVNAQRGRRNSFNVLVL